MHFRPSLVALNRFVDIFLSSPSHQESAIAWIHVPYFPAFHRPGWLMRYVVGPFNDEWLEMLFADFGAGLTVGLTLIPQGNVPWCCLRY